MEVWYYQMALERPSRRCAYLVHYLVQGEWPNSEYGQDSILLGDVAIVTLEKH